VSENFSDRLTHGVRNIMTAVIPLHSFTTKQVSGICLVPIPKIYQLKKGLESGLHFIETRSTSNTKQIEWFTPGLTQIELSHWVSIGRKSAWSAQRLEAFKCASIWLAEVAA